jgi:3-oxoadipate enol-lactonase
MLRVVSRPLAGLVLADTRVGADTETGRQGRRDMQQLVDREGADGVAEAMLPKLLGETTRRDQPQLVAQVSRWIRGAAPDAIKSALECLMTRPDSTTPLQAFRGPALIVRGVDDALIAAGESERMRGLLTNADMIEIPAAGHLPNLEQPDAFNQAWTTFLRERCV